MCKGCALRQQAAGGGRWLAAYLYGLEPSQLPSLHMRKEVWRRATCPQKGAVVKIQICSLPVGLLREVSTTAPELTRREKRAPGSLQASHCSQHSTLSQGHRPGNNHSHLSSYQREQGTL